MRKVLLWLACVFLISPLSVPGQESSADPQFSRTTASAVAGLTLFVPPWGLESPFIYNGPVGGAEIVTGLGTSVATLGMRATTSYHQTAGDDIVITSLSGTAGLGFPLGQRFRLDLAVGSGFRMGVIGPVAGASFLADLSLRVAFLFRNQMELAYRISGEYWHGFQFAMGQTLELAFPVSRAVRWGRGADLPPRPQKLDEAESSLQEPSQAEPELLTEAEPETDPPPAPPEPDLGESETTSVASTTSDGGTASGAGEEPEPSPPEPQYASERTDDTIAVSSLFIEQVFPVFYKYYNNNPFGSLTIRNLSERPVNNLRVEFFVPRYMDAPRAAIGPGQIGAGEEVELSITALFADDIVSVTAATVATAGFTVTYGSVEELTFDTTLQIADRNATTWDDDRKVAAFVTPNDPSVLVLSRGASAVVRASGYASVNEPLQKAMGVFETLRLHGLQYVIDPSTPYAQYSQQDYVVDYLQYPQQTLRYRAGDCDDLSICFAAALQSVGVRPAFITVPGHIYTAFATGLTPSQARRMFSRAEELIFYDDEAWIPVETTLLADGFLRAWEQGARTWRENNVREQAEIFTLADAWDIYEGVGLRDAGNYPQPPPQAEIAEAYAAQMTRFIDREIFPQVAALQNRIDSSGGDPAYINRLGVLYGRYGLNDRARAQFERVLEEDPLHAGALVNLGHLYFLQGDMAGALPYYERAYEASSGNPRIILALTRVHHELENYGLASQHYERLSELDPDMAIRFSYLDFRGEEATRAAQIAEITNVVVWEEGE